MGFGISFVLFRAGKSGFYGVSSRPVRPVAAASLYLGFSRFLFREVIVEMLMSGCGEVLSGEAAATRACVGRDEFRHGCSRVYVGRGGLENGRDRIGPR